MIHIRQPFFSIAASAVFGLLALLLDAATNSVVVIGGTELTSSAAWALTGVLFLMAYFSLVHLKD